MTKMSPFQIKNFRKQTGLSQKAFAQAVNLPIRTYRSYESGERGLLTSSENSKKNSVTIKSVTKTTSGLTSTICDLPSLVYGI